MKYLAKEVVLMIPAILMVLIIALVPAALLLFLAKSKDCHGWFLLSSVRTSRPR